MKNNPDNKNSSTKGKYSFLSDLSLPQEIAYDRNKIEQNPYFVLIDTVQRHYNSFLEYENKLDEEKEQRKKTHSQFEKFLLEMFEVVDFLEGVLETTENIKTGKDEDMKNLIENFQQGLKLFQKKFAGIEVEPYMPKPGEAFIPGKNYSVGTQKSEKLPEKTICKIVKKGYTWKGRLLRPAYVMVVKN